MTRIDPYLHFDGQCRAAFEFYAEVLRGRIALAMTYGEEPPPAQIDEHSKGRMMHMSLAVGDRVIMGSDMPAGRHEGMKGFAISLTPSDPAEAERLYDALPAGGTVRMPLQETFWAVRFGMLVDRFGTPWMINCEK